MVERDPATDLLTVNREFTVSLVLARCQLLDNGRRRWKVRFDNRADSGAWKDHAGRAQAAGHHKTKPLPSRPAGGRGHPPRIGRLVRRPRQTGPAGLHTSHRNPLAQAGD